MITSLVVLLLLVFPVRDGAVEGGRALDEVDHRRTAGVPQWQGIRAAVQEAA